MIWNYTDKHRTILFAEGHRLVIAVCTSDRHHDGHHDRVSLQRFECARGSAWWNVGANCPGGPSRKSPASRIACGRCSSNQDIPSLPLPLQPGELGIFTIKYRVADTNPPPHHSNSLHHGQEPHVVCTGEQQIWLVTRTIERKKRNHTDARIHYRPKQVES